MALKLKLELLVNGNFKQLTKIEEALKILNKNFDNVIPLCNHYFTVEVVKENIKYSLEENTLKISEWFLETSSVEKLAAILEDICHSNRKHKEEN